MNFALSDTRNRSGNDSEISPDLSGSLALFKYSADGISDKFGDTEKS